MRWAIWQETFSSMPCPCSSPKAHIYRGPNSNDAMLPNVSSIRRSIPIEPGSTKRHSRIRGVSVSTRTLEAPDRYNES
jgi:hypothetical protein